MFKKLRKEISNIFDSVCSHKEECEHYQLNGFTCNKEPGPYCGIWREFEKKKLNKS